MRFVCNFALLALGLLVIPSGAEAQARVLVLPTLSDASRATAARQLAARLEVELRAQGGAPLSSDEVSRRLSESLSAPATTPERDTFDQIIRCMDEVLVLTASQQVGRARTLGQRCLGLAEVALETLNRRTEAAQQVLDGCLYNVRAILESAQARRSTTAPREAQAEARRCRTLVPDLQPTTRMHPPFVLDAFAEVDRQIGEARSELRVFSREPSCAVYLNGRRLGATPFVQRGLPGSAFRVQVECGGVPGRVHRVQLGSEPTELHVDERFDGSIADTPRLHLRYPDGLTAAGHRLEDATRVARALAVDEVWLLAYEGEDRWRVDRVLLPAGRVAASARLSAPSPTEGFAYSAGARSVTLLQSGESRDLSEARERPFVAWSAPGDAPASADEGSSDPDAAPSWAPHPLAWVGLATGVAALGTSWGLSFAGSQEPGFDDGLAITYTTLAMAGGLLSALSLPAWLPEDEAFAWGLSIPSGLGAVALIVYGAVALAEHDACVAMVDVAGGELACRRMTRGDLAAVTAWSAAIPLLEVPIVYLVRALVGSPTATARVQTSRYGALLSVGDSF